METIKLILTTPNACGEPVDGAAHDVPCEVLEIGRTDETAQRYRAKDYDLKVLIRPSAVDGIADLLYAPGLRFEYQGRGHSVSGVQAVKDFDGEVDHYVVRLRYLA